METLCKIDKMSRKIGVILAKTGKNSTDFRI
nr:MAG TPA: hypothetical protein [Caudoviricetes sp.]